MKKLLTILALSVATFSHGQQKGLTPLSLKDIAADCKKDTGATLLVFNKVFDGENYWLAGGYPVKAETVLQKTWLLLDSLKLSVPAKERTTILNNIKKEGSQEITEQPGIKIIDIWGQEHKNLSPNIMVGDDTPKEVVNEMIRRRLDKIKSETPAAEQMLYQFSNPYYYNSNKNTLILFVIAKPGEYDIYAMPYSLVKGRWMKQGAYLILNQKTISTE